MRNKNNKSNGFTIIEVLIVLAIAGLIMLIVFLAVPALQRNAHNTSAKNDVAGLLGAVNEYVNNNNGSVPATAASLGTSSNNTATVGGSGTNTAEAKLGYFTPDKVSIVNYTSGVTQSGDQTRVVIVLGASCDGLNAESAASRNYVALFTLEGGAKQCQAS